MNTPTSSQFKKIIIVVMILLILVSALFYINTQKNVVPPQIPTPTPIAAVTKSVLPPDATASLLPTTGQMLFNNVPKTVGVGESFDITVDLKIASEKIDGADSIVKFDPKLLTVEKVTDGSYFQEYPRKFIDNEKGEVKITAFNPRSKEAVNNIPLFTITFRTQNSGTARLSFDFQKGRTNLSTIVEKGTSRNILGSVGSATIVIE